MASEEYQKRIRELNQKLKEESEKRKEAEAKLLKERKMFEVNWKRVDSEKGKSPSPKRPKTRALSNVDEWKNLLSHYGPEVSQILSNALYSVDPISCTLVDIAAAFGKSEPKISALGITINEVAPAVHEIAFEERKRLSSISDESLMADKMELVPPEEREEDATFWYLGLNPVKAEVKVPGSNSFSVQLVNGYLDHIAFTDLNGVFRSVGRSGTKTMFLFEFANRKACSNTKDSREHEALVSRRNDGAGLDVSLLDVNLFRNEDTSPGKEFFQVPSFVSFQEKDGWKIIRAENTLKNTEIKHKSYDRESEDTITSNMYSVLTEVSKKRSWGISIFDRNFDCKYSPFSGGGDIMVFHDSGAILLQTSASEFKSLTDEDDYRLAFDIENKINSLDGFSLERQLLANMMVTLSKGVVRLCKMNDNRLHSFEKLSVYGLSLHRLLPMQMFKLTMNFKDGRLVIKRKVAFSLEPFSFNTVDKLISYMIRNITGKP